MPGHPRYKRGRDEFLCFDGRYKRHAGGILPDVKSGQAVANEDEMSYRFASGRCGIAPLQALGAGGFFTRGGAPGWGFCPCRAIQFSRFLCFDGRYKRYAGASSFTNEDEMNELVGYR